MSSVPSSYIDDIKRIVRSALNQTESQNIRWMHGVEKVNDAEWSDVNYGVTVCTSATRPTGYHGRLIYETDTDAFLGYNGAAWVNVGGASGAYLPLAGGTMTGNIVMGDNDITGANAVQATASQDLTLKVSTGKSIIFQAV